MTLYPGEPVASPDSDSYVHYKPNIKILCFKNALFVGAGAKGKVPGALTSEALILREQDGGQHCVSASMWEISHQRPSFRVMLLAGSRIYEHG